MKRGKHFCIVCKITYGMEQVYKTGMYRFCSEKCYANYRKLDSKTQLKLQERKRADPKTDRQLYQQHTL